MRAGSGRGASSLESARDAAAEAVRQVQSGPPGRAVDLAVFISPAHMDEAEVAAEVVRAELAPRHLLGCVAEGVLARELELEEVPPWPSGRAALGPRSNVTRTVQIDDGVAVTGVPELDDPTLVALLVDPFTFPTGRSWRN